MALVGIVQFHPAALFNATGVDFVPINLAADSDLTDSVNGPTSGYSARWVQVGGTGGNLLVVTPGSPTVTRTIPVSANTVYQLCACKILSTANGTTCTPVNVIL